MAVVTPYVPQVWTDNVTPADAAHMTAIENGLASMVRKPGALADGEAPVWDATNGGWERSSVKKIARASLDFGAGLVNADVAAGAAVARSKLDFGAGLVNADVAAAAAIARSKLDFGTGLVNADIAAAAAIAPSKIGGGYGPNKITVSTFAGGPPASPGDMDLWVATGVDGLGTRWTFQYNAGSASAFKWEFFGGPPVQNRVNTQENTASGTFVNLATVGPTYTFVRAGDYLIDFGYQAIAVAAGPANAGGELFLNGSDLAVGISHTLAGSGVGNIITTSMRYRNTGFAAADVLTMRYAVSNGVNTGFYQRFFQITPIRIS